MLPCAAIAVLGGLTTQLLTRTDHDAQPNPKRSGRIAAARVIGLGLGLVALGYALQWGYDPAGGGLFGTWTAPFSKWFFSPAYCLLAAGTGAVLYAAFFWVIDVERVTSAFVLRVYGLNAIALHLAAELSFKVLWARWLMLAPGPDDSLTRQSWAGGSMAWLSEWLGLHAGLWAHALLYLALWWGFCYWLCRNKWFLKV